MAVGSALPRPGGYQFEVRYSEGALARAEAAADVAANAYVYFSRLFSAQPDIAIIVASQADWSGHGPYGLPFFRDDAGEIRPGIVLMPAGGGDFWTGIGQDIRDASPRGYAKLLAACPDGAGGLDLQPFFDLITIHELGHAFEVLGDLRLPTFWLSEIFANLAMHALFQLSFLRASRLSRFSRPWGRAAGSLPRVFGPRATARSRNSKPITRPVTTRWTR